MPEGKEGGKERETTSAFGLKVKVIEYQDYDSDAQIYDTDAYAVFVNAKFIKEWYSEMLDTGHYLYRLYAGDTGLFVERIWVPAIGYSWEERAVYKLIFEGE